MNITSFYIIDYKYFFRPITSISLFKSIFNNDTLTLSPIENRGSFFEILRL